MRRMPLSATAAAFALLGASMASERPAVVVPDTHRLPTLQDLERLRAAEAKRARRAAKRKPLALQTKAG